MQFEGRGPSVPSLTEQLRLYTEGEREVAESILRQVLPKLRQIAARELRRERHLAPLSPTELINEAWIRKLQIGGWAVSNREHFYAIAALAMRRVLIEIARSRLAQRRGRGEEPSAGVQALYEATGPDPEQIVRIGMLLEQLTRSSPEIARVVDLHYFAGFTLEEICEITSLSLRQVRSRWEKGRDWLKDRL